MSRYFKFLSLANAGKFNKYSGKAFEAMLKNVSFGASWPSSLGSKPERLLYPRSSCNNDAFNAPIADGKVPCKPAPPRVRFATKLRVHPTPPQLHHGGGNVVTRLAHVVRSHDGCT